MAGWHHWVNGCESEWTPGVGDGEWGLVCCDSWGCKESDTTEWLIWSDLICDEIVMFLGSAGWFRAPETMATHNVAAGLIVQLIVDSQLLDLPLDFLLMFSLSLTKYACSMTTNFWCSPIPVSLKEVRERRVLVCLVGSIVLMYMSQFVQAFSSLSTVGPVATSNFPS